MQGIYKIKNKVNGKYYVGSTNNSGGRWRDHCRALRKNLHDNSILQYAWNKYGKENFIFEFAEEVLGKDARLAREQVYLDEGFAQRVLYNIARQARQPPGISSDGHSAETKAKISASLMKHEVTEEARAKMSKSHKGRIPWNKGKEGCYSDKVLQQMSQAHIGLEPGNKGIPATEEAIQKNRESSLKYYETHDGPMLGKHHSQEARDKMSISHIEYYETHDAWNKGIPCSEEQKLKIGAANARFYPAFYNEQTGEAISAGVNLSKLCREKELPYGQLLALKLGRTTYTNDGWKLSAP